MIYSTSTKYAVMALIELATRQDDRPVQIKEISETTGIPRHFLAKLVQTLVKADILSSSKGRGGGLRFARPPSQISLAEVVRAIDGEGALQSCIFGLQRCDGTRNCPIHPMWGPIREQIISFLENTTVADLAANMRSGE
jgi:Rrf2 family protein